AAYRAGHTVLFHGFRPLSFPLYTKREKKVPYCLFHRHTDRIMNFVPNKRPSAAVLSAAHFIFQFVALIFQITYLLFQRFQGLVLLLIELDHFIHFALYRPALGENGSQGGSILTVLAVI